MNVRIRIQKISARGEEPLTDKQLRYLKALCRQMRIKLPRGNPKHLISKNLAMHAIKQLIEGNTIEFCE